MATYNYIKPHWRNGPHAVHDAPDWALAIIEGTLSNASPQTGGELVRIERDSEVELSIAWITCSVSLYTEDEASSYRRARYIHAIAVDDEDGTRLDAALARQLFEDVYGNPIVAGVGSHQRIFGQLDHSGDRNAATNLFAEAPRLRRVDETIHDTGLRPSTAPPTSLSSLLTFQSPNPVSQADDEEEASVRDTQPDLKAVSLKATGEQSVHADAEDPEVAFPPPACLRSAGPGEWPEADDSLTTSLVRAPSRSRRASHWAVAAGLLAAGIIMGAAIGLLLSPEQWLEESGTRSRAEATSSAVEDASRAPSVPAASATPEDGEA